MINIEGDEDKVEKFLQGQVTSDVDCVSSGIMQLSSICNQKGLVMAGFILTKKGLKFKVIKHFNEWISKNNIVDKSLQFI